MSKPLLIALAVVGVVWVVRSRAADPLRTAIGEFVYSLQGGAGSLPGAWERPDSPKWNAMTAAQRAEYDARRAMMDALYPRGPNGEPGF